MSFIRWIILGIIALVVVGMTILIFGGSIQKIASSLSESFGFSGLSDDEKYQAGDNFNILIGNVESCMQINDQDCACQGLPNFPATFRQDSLLIIEEKNKQTQINWSYKNKVYYNEIINNLKLNAIVISKDSSQKVQINYNPRKQIDFNVELPEFIQEGYSAEIFEISGKRIAFHLVTGYLYKTQDSINFVISGDNLKELEINLKEIKICGTDQKLNENI